MDPHRLDALLRTQLDGRRLLDHPFYRRWSRGEVSVAELRAYAAQYRHFEAMIPSHLAAVAAASDGAGLREQALRNLADETAAPSHVELFERFATALDAPHSVAPSAAMQRLLDVHRDAVAGGAATGLAALYAYEVQSAAVSASKAEGLRVHGILSDDVALSFWDTHASLDDSHAAWACEALAHDGADADSLAGAVRAAADAWWSFLDEREALRA